MKYAWSPARALFVGPLLGVVALVGCAKHEIQAPPALTAVRAIHATQGDVYPRKELAGVIAPRQNVILSTSLAEPALEVRVIEGSHIAAGEILAVLDTSDLQANLRAQEALAQQAQANLARQRATSTQIVGQGIDAVSSTKATLDQTQERRRLDQLTLTRDEHLLQQSFIPQQTVDNQRSIVQNDIAAETAAQAALRTAQVVVQTNGSGTVPASGSAGAGIQASTIAASEAAVAAAHAQADQLRAQIARAIITAPIDAIVVNRNFNPGEYPNGRTLFVLQQTGAVYAVLNASPSQVDGVRVGTSATVQLTAFSGHPYHGKVVAVLGQASPGSTNFSIKVLLDTGNDTLLTGLPVRAQLTLAPLYGVRIPRSAFTDETETNVVTLVNDTIRLRAVTEIAQDTHQAIITGIEPGTLIVTNGDAALTQGQRVVVR